MTSQSDRSMSPLVILAGGRGRRIGGDKPLYPFGGTTLIQATLARLSPTAGPVYINAGLAGTALANGLEPLGWPLIFDADDVAGLGPLSGVCTALRLARSLAHEEVITVPCDMPYLPYDMIDQLRRADHEADIVYFAGRRDYPLCALWRTRRLTSLEDALQQARPSGGLRVMAYIAMLHALTLVPHDDQAFQSINCPEDIRELPK